MRNHWCLPWKCHIALIAFSLGCSSSGTVTLKPEPIPATAVKTVALTQTLAQRTTVQPATVHAYYRAEIRAKVTGYVESLKVDIGEYVEAGAELARISVPELEKQREIAQARIRRLEAEEQRSLAGTNLASARLRSAQAKLNESKSQLQSAEAAFAAAEAEFNRTEDMVQRGSLQSRVLDETRMKRDSEAARREAMASSIESAQAEVAVAEAQVAAAKADEQAATAETDVARRQLEELDVLLAYTTIKAPFSGIVTERNIEPGDLVRELSEVGHGRPLFVISQTERVRIRIPVPETDAPRVNPGDAISLNFPSFVDEAPMVATVTRRSSSLDPSTRTMLVEAEMPNKDGKLLPGMFGQAFITMASDVAANVLPAQAIRFGDDGKAFVYVVGQDDRVSIAEVTTGSDDGSSIEVLSGLSPGQRVISSHLKRFTDGQKVNPL